ncbi:hypothetical protein PFISCL1PPCAC_9729, partial [Pristionchus fissidentatus]
LMLHTCILQAAAFVYQFNKREKKIIKKGAVVHMYSVSRTFQLNENISLIQMLLRISIPLVFSCTPAFIFYPVYKLVPPHIGYDGLRYFSVEMYDLWLAIYVGLILLCLP